MSLHVKWKRLSSGTFYWKIQRSVWVQGKVKYEHIPSSQLLQYGLNPDMSIEDARARVKQLNAQARLDQGGDRRKAASLRQLSKRQKIDSAHLPTIFVQEFVETYLRAETERGTNPAYSYKKATIQWECAKKLIVAVGMPQQHWFQHKRRFYNEFVKRELSLSYAGKVLRVLNLWGQFIAMKTGTSFIPIPSPNGFDSTAIRSAHSENGKKKKDSLPLTQNMLDNAKGKFKDEQWNWLFVSLWFGLRAPEISGKWKVSGSGNRQVLEVYQSKLVGIDPDKRWKFIPVKYPEQKAALKLLIAGKLKRPYPVTIQKVLGEGYNTHAGRKGFTGLMQDLGEPFDIVSDWLGHQDIRITHAAYRDKTRAKWGKAS